MHAEGLFVPATNFMFKGQDWKPGGLKFCSWLRSRLTETCGSPSVPHGSVSAANGRGKSCTSFGVHNLAKSMAVLQWKSQQGNQLSEEHLLEVLCWF